LQIVDARLLSQKARFIAARVDPHSPRRLAAAAKCVTRCFQLALIYQILCLFSY
jgi:hypothetical protein